MKAKNASYLLVVCTWLIVITVSAFILPVNAWFALTLVSIMLIAVLIAALHYTIFKPIQQLNHQIKSILTNKSVRLTKTATPEVNEIAAEINELISRIHETKDSGEATRQALEASEQTNALLREEILKHKSKGKQNERMPLTKLSHYDVVTALPNRIFFNEILNKAMSHARRRKKICALLFIGLDNFKNLSQQLTQEQLVTLTKDLSSRLLTTLRSEDVLARFSDDQYMVLLTDIGKPKFASSVAEKLLHALSMPIKSETLDLPLSAHIGICIYPNDGHSLEALLTNAETALEQARRTDKGSYQFYASELNTEAREFITLDNALRKALQKNELALYYQPKFRIKTGAIDGVETLLRWINPELGNISASQIITLAEETGMTMKLLEWTLLEACRTNKHWQDEGYEHMTVAVNISAMQFHHPDLMDVITRVLAQTKLHPGYLEIEINESAVMEDTDMASHILEAMKDIGLQITIDHFGTGYTSISHLKRFPINFLKIDRSFIKGLPQNPNDMAIINAFLAMAHNLGLEVIAEGVESAEQVQYLSLQNCDLVQGYFLSHPLPPDRLIVQLSELRDEVLI